MIDDPHDGDAQNRAADLPAEWAARSPGAGVRRPPKVVIFTGGRGSRSFTDHLLRHPGVELTLAVNGYDDGASTGEVRRLLGDCLGPSDFRKNASRLAKRLATCGAGLVDLVDWRLPVGCTPDQAKACFEFLGRSSATARAASSDPLERIAEGVEEDARRAVGRRLARFAQAHAASRLDFAYSDCSLGNLVFAGCFLDAGRSFPRAVEDYCALLGLPPGLIENVTDGTNAYLVGLDAAGRVLASEAAIVEAERSNGVSDVFVVERPLAPAEIARIDARPDRARRALEERAVRVAPSPRLLRRIGEADLVLYAPGTQHSSLLPSYLTAGLGAAIGANKTAIKLLVTNLHQGVATPATTAADIARRALQYLRGAAAPHVSAADLVTYYVVNRPARALPDLPYVAPGAVHRLENPQAVWLDEFELGATGLHDAGRVLEPFLVRREGALPAAPANPAPIPRARAAGVRP